jgi:hypothetical protein
MSIGFNRESPASPIRAASTIKKPRASANNAGAVDARPDNERTAGQ